MTLFHQKTRTRRFVKNVAGYDHWLTFSVAALLLFGTLLVWAATKNWFASQHLDPQYYLKRHLINMLIGLILAYGTTLIDYRLLRAYTPIVWGLGVLGLLAWKGYSVYSKVKAGVGNITPTVSFLRIHGLIGDGLTKFISPVIRTLFNLNIKNFSGFDISVTKNLCSY